MERLNKQQYTLLRIKRKRDDDAQHLDALRVKKARSASAGAYAGQSGVFTYVDTVNDESFFEDSDFQTRLSTLHSEPVLPRKIVQNPRVSASKLSSTGRSQPQFNIVKANLPSSTSTKSVDDKNTSPAPGTSAPDVTTTSAAGFTLYDAVEPTRAVPNIIPDTANPDMDIFSDMVKDYLTMNNIDLDLTPAPPSNTSIQVPTDPVLSVPSSDLDHDQYVYDLFMFRRDDTDAMDIDDGHVGTIMVRPGDDVEFLASSDDEVESILGGDDDPDSNDEGNPAYDYPDASESESSESDWLAGQLEDSDDDY